ncbi:hypothetical protein IFT54_05490 [Sphingomonas sp. CFBP 13714]|uniref:hypothetical protein n=1 Tax=Sphingomonas sp. CFBP 13714 TaxID=2775308 RepID=UPI001783933E|nr:hypothetical protein [Sphingomonas sp. CFBP 13714]MBD8699268.1 hypothetical protein [Sphingomonas sp. CFBP 13714]
MNERQTLLAFGALIVAICYLATIAAVLAFYGKYAEALGFGGLTTGLVGVLGTFKPRTSSPDNPQAVTVTNTASDPVPVEAAPHA